jgi:hypothetical protein
MIQSSDPDAAGAQFGYYHFDTFLFDSAQAVVGYFQADESALGFQPEPQGVQVGQEAPTPTVIGVRDGITRHGAFTGNLANSRHGDFLCCPAAERPAKIGRALYQRQVCWASQTA